MGALVGAWRGNAAPCRMVSRRPQHPVSPSLPPVSRTPGEVSLDQVEAILHDLRAQQFLHVDHLPDPCQREAVNARVSRREPLVPNSIVVRIQRGDLLPLE